MVDLKVSHSTAGSIRFHQHYLPCVDLMTDLLLQDLKDLTNERLALILSNEKRQMLGEQEVPVKRRAVHLLPVNFFAESVTGLRKAEARNVTE
jgi:hypothetical protein